MLIYWLLFASAAWPAYKYSAATNDRSGRGRWSGAWSLWLGALALLIGLRHEVGGDWGTYAGMIEVMQYEPSAFNLVVGDPAYQLLNWVGANLGGGVYLVNSVCAALFCAGLHVFCRAQPRPWLAALVAVPYLITVVAMGYTRQGVAIGLSMLAITQLLEGRTWLFLWWVTVAALFHKSVAILVPLGFLVGHQPLVYRVLAITIAGSVLVASVLQGAVETLRTSYIEAEYASAGATARIAMNTLPAVLFLWLRRRFRLSLLQRKVWTVMAVTALGFPVLLAVSPSSTAVDRFALYWIPLQLFVWSRLPDALAVADPETRPWVLSVIGYSATVYFVWLFFADFSSYWLPYQFFPATILF